MGSSLHSPVPKPAPPRPPGANFSLESTKRFHVPLFLPEKPLPESGESWTTSATRKLIQAESFGLRDFHVLKRMEWGTQQPKPEYMNRMDEVTSIVFHHTASQPKEGDTRPFAVARGIETMHLKPSSSSSSRTNPGTNPILANRPKDCRASTDPKDSIPGDIGYHFLISPGPDGHWHILEGRSLKFQGAHAGMSKDCRNMNKGSIAIAFVMDSRVKVNRGVQPPPEAVYRAGQLVRWLQARYPGIQGLYTHGSEAPGEGLAWNPGHTLCPGHSVENVVREFRQHFRRPEVLPAAGQSSGQVAPAQ